MTMTSQSPSVSRPLGHRPWFSEAVLKTALARIIQNGTMILRLPDDRILSFGSGDPVVVAKIQDWKTLGGSRSTPIWHWARPIWMAHCM